MAEAGALSLYAALLRGELEGDEALRASRHIFELVMNNVEQAIWWKDADSVYLGCNRKLAEYAGVSDPSEMIGKTDSDFPWGGATEARSGSEWFKGHDRQVVETGESILGLREQVRMVGDRVMWVETNKVPVKDLDGNVIGTLGTFVDISDRIEAEQELTRTLEALDERVKERTSELRNANSSLRREIEERRRLEQRERRRRAQAETLRDTAAAIARSLQLDDVIEQVLGGVGQLFDHHRSQVLLYDDDGLLRLASERTPGGPVVDAEPDRVVSNPLEGAIPLSAWEPNGPHTTPGEKVIVPLQVADRRLGYLAVEPLSGPELNAEEVGLLATIADQASSAISNSRALMMARSLAAIEERQRLANDLHDSVSQTLWTATLVAETLGRDTTLTQGQIRQVDRLRLLTTGALSEMRTLLLELRPQVIEETPFADLINQLAAAFESRKHTSCTVVRGQLPDLVGPVKVALYRILQESLNNVARHAEATEVIVAVEESDGCLRLSVGDDGVGFDTGNVTEHMGLQIMSERAAAVGAKFEVLSRRGEGTSVTVEVSEGLLWPG